MNVQTEPLKAVMFDEDKNKTMKNEQEEEEERSFKICHL
jgi:hypothetical protein